MKKQKGMNLIEFILLSSVVLIISIYGVNYFSQFLEKMFPSDGSGQHTQFFNGSNRTAIDSEY